MKSGRRRRPRSRPGIRRISCSDCGSPYYYPQWAYEDWLVDLSDEILPFASLFDPDALAFATLLDATTGRRALRAADGDRNRPCPRVAQPARAGRFTLDDIPRQWQAFWAFWCDEVQPAVRRVTGRDDLWGVGLPLSAEASDTNIGFEQFMQAYEANYVTPEREAGRRRPRDQTQADPGHGQLHGHLPRAAPPDAVR